MKNRWWMVCALSLLASPLLAAERPAEAAAAAEPPRFLLLIHGDDAPPAERDAVVAAYTAWARELAAEGRLVAAAELAPDAKVVAAKPATADATASAGGYFLITAPDLAAALEIARGCPAVARGGSVEVLPEVR